MEQSKLNSQGITRIKSAAVFLVVLIHVVALPVNEYGKGGSLIYWWAYVCGHLGVPLFVMCSGALLLQEKYGIWQTKGEIKRRVFRIMVPLLVYGWAYAMIELVFEAGTFSLQMLAQALIRVIKGESWSHLWYLYMMLGLYLLLPCIRYLYWGTDILQKRGILRILILFGTVMPVVARLFGNTYSGANLLSWSLPASICYILYFLTGALLVQHDFSKRMQKYLDATGIVSLLILFLWPVAIKEAALKNAAIEYDSICVFLSAAWLFSKLYYKCNFCFSAMLVLDRYSFGIYLIHPLFMNLLYKWANLTPLQGSGVFTIPLFTFVFISLSAVCVWCISKVPVARKWLI